MCWKTVLSDDSGQLEVAAWDKACYELLQITSNKLREFWEKGVEQPAEQASILESLNSKVDAQVMCFCEAKLWTYGQKDVKHIVQINVNSLEQTG